MTPRLFDKMAEELFRLLVVGSWIAFLAAFFFLAWFFHLGAPYMMAGCGLWLVALFTFLAWPKEH